MASPYPMGCAGMGGNSLSLNDLRNIPSSAAIPGVWGSPEPGIVNSEPRCTPLAGSHAVLG